MATVRLKALLAGASLCAVTAGAPAAHAANVVPPEVDRESGSRTVTTDTGRWIPPTSGYRYAWYRCTSLLPASCTQPIAGAAGPSYVLRTADIGFYIRSRVSDAAGEDPTFSRNAEGPIRAAPPVNTTAPRVSGTARSGRSLTATAGSWDGRVVGDPPFAFQWQRCSSAGGASCSNVPGATRPSYTLGTADVGRFVRLVVEAEGLGRAATVAPDPALGPVPAAAGNVRFALLRPFPIVVIAGRLRGATTRIGDFVVRGPWRARVSLRCIGRRCPFRRIGAMIGKRKRLRIRRAQRAFHAGQVLEVRVTGTNRTGKYTRIAFRRRRTPRRRDLCLSPVMAKPSPCPAS